MNTPKIYVADLAAYNEGKLIGEWLDLSEYDSGEEVMDAISDLLKGWSKEQGVKREEYAIHDVENIPNNLYSEYMGEKTFDKIVNIQNVADEIGIPFDVIVEWMGESGYEDPQDAVDSYLGAYKDEEDFAYEMVEDIGITSFTDFERYLYVSDTDRRIIAGEEEQRFREDAEYDGDLSEEEINERADEIYDEWYKGLEDPYDFLVEEQGLYSAEDFSNVSFVQVDYEKLAEALGYDYNFVGGDDGMTYVFNRNFKKGGSVRSTHSINQDRKRLSQEDWEQAYKPKRKGAYYEKGGSVTNNYQVLVRKDNNSPYEIKADELSEKEARDVAIRLEESGRYFDVKYEVGLPFKKGGSVRSTHSINQDRKRLSQEDWEQAYKPKRKGAYYEKGGSTYQGGVEIGFLPMDLEEDLMITAKWGGTNIQGVIGFLNAMIDSEITDEDLKLYPTKNTRFQYERAKEKKIQEIWSKINPNYKGGLKGNMYYSTIKRLVERASAEDNILKRFKPFRKYQKDEYINPNSYQDGGEIISNELYEELDKRNDWKIIEKKQHPLRKTVFLTLSKSGDYYRIVPVSNGKELERGATYFTKIELAKKDFDKTFQKYFAKGGSVSSQVAQDIEDLEAVIESDFVPQHAKDKAKKELERLRASIESDVEKVEKPIKKAVEGDLPKSKYEIGDKVLMNGEEYIIKDKAYRNNIDDELTWVYYLPEYSSVLVSEKNLKPSNKSVTPKKATPKTKSKTTKPRAKGEASIMGRAHALAKKIRKDEEDYHSAFKRAMEQLKKGAKSPSTTKKKTITSKKRAVKPTTTPTKKKKVVSKKRALRPVDQTERGKEMDAKRQALPAGKRISKDGNVYYEYRANHADKFQPTKKTVTSKKRKLLAKGGEVNSENIKVGDKFYSYENPDTLYGITYISGDGENKRYKIALKDKDGYSYSSKNLSLNSLSKTSRKSDAKKVKLNKMTKNEFKEKWGSTSYIDKY